MMIYPKTLIVIADLCPPRPETSPGSHLLPRNTLRGAWHLLSKQGAISHGDEQGQGAAGMAFRQICERGEGWHLAGQV